MGNKNPSSRVVNIPAQFLSLVEKERDDLGCFTTCEIMGRILAGYFGKKAQNPTKIEPQKDTNTREDQVIKGVKVNDS